MHANPDTHRRRHACDDIGDDADPFTLAVRHAQAHGHQGAHVHTESDSHTDPNRT